MKRTCSIVVVVFVIGVAGGHVDAAEGKWTPDQVLELEPRALAEQGLKLAPSEIWDAEGGGLLSAVVNLGGCSAAFVSPDGLLITNHHCAYGLIQKNSTPDRDLLDDGFLALNRAGELPGEGERASVPLRLTDVTDQIEAAVPEGVDDLGRWRAIERRRKALVKVCEATPGRRCAVRSEDDGVRYILEETLELSDVRLVWSPPRMVGEFGGAVDNWMWPRHSGDVSLLRVYSGDDNLPAAYDPGNRPYRPARWTPLAGEDLDDGDFVMVAGYPYRTTRRYIAEEMATVRDLYFPQRSVLYSAWIEILEEAGAASEASRLAVMSRIKSLANGEKNARGQLVGYGRGHLVESKRGRDEEVLRWAAEGPERTEVAEAYRGLIALELERRGTWSRDFLLTQMRRGSLPLANALDIVRWVRERPKADLDRLDGFQDRDRERLEDRLKVAQKRYQADADALLLADTLDRLGALSEAQRPALGFNGDFEAAARGILSKTLITDAEARLGLLDLDEVGLSAMNDPLINVALLLDDARRESEEARDRRRGAISKLRPVWRRGISEFLGRPLDPDANGGLRVSLAEVRGYSPQDAVWMQPQTRLAGMVAKNTGELPFAAPERVLEAASGGPESRWADADLGDVPVAFLADADTTGGNSGSPVFDGSGRVVGINFDRVWENVANDAGYNPEIARNVSVDIRYVLWLLEATEKGRAGWLLKELGF